MKLHFSADEEWLIELKLIKNFAFIVFIGGCRLGEFEVLEMEFRVVVLMLILDKFHVWESVYY